MLQVFGVCVLPFVLKQWSHVAAGRGVTVVLGETFNVETVS